MVASSFETGHADMIHDSQLDYYGRRLATCSSDRTVKIFELAGETRHHIADLTGHEGPARRPPLLRQPSAHRARRSGR